MANILKDKSAIVLNAAMDCARENSFTRITRRCVADRAQVAAGTVHTAFGGMDGLRDAVIHEAIRINDLELIAQGLANKHPATEALPADVKRMVAETLIAG